MDTLKDTTMQHVTDAVIAEIKRAAEHPAKAPVIVRADTMLGVLARIEQLESDLATAEQDSRQKQARIDRLEEEESKQAALLDCLNGWKAMAKSAEKERDTLRDKIECMDGALESLLIRCDDSDSAMYGTLSTSFVRDTVRITRGEQE